MRRQRLRSIPRRTKSAPMASCSRASRRTCYRSRNGIFCSDMTVVDRVYRHTEIPEHARSYARQTITLGWEARTHVHGRRVTDSGVEFGTSLPRGTVLGDGDCFVLDAERLVVSVVARAEPVFVIEPRDPREWALFAYHIGNRHQPLMIAGGA